MKDRAWLLNGYCHLVNKNIHFIQKYFEGIVPAGRPDEEIYWHTKATCEKLREALESEAEVNAILEEYLAFATEYFEQGAPWSTREQDRRACRNTILTSLQMVANLTVWLTILGEYPANRVSDWLELNQEWKVHSVHSGLELTGAGTSTE